jgi:hypothetical protein
VRLCLQRCLVVRRVPLDLLPLPLSRPRNQVSFPALHVACLLYFALIVVVVLSQSNRRAPELRRRRPTKVRPSPCLKSLTQMLPPLCLVTLQILL